MDVLWDRTIVTTIPISGIGYWDSLTSLGQNGFYVISFTVLHITCHFHVLFHFPMFYRVCYQKGEGLV